jgi:hypothetical protein
MRATTEAFALKPAYERKIVSGRLLIGVFLIILIIAEVVIYWGLSSGRNPSEYIGVAITFLFGLPLVAYFVISSAMRGKEKLVPFISSTVNMIRSWACIGPLLETGGYEAVCELSNGCYVQCLFGVMGNRKEKGGILRVFRFVKRPETVVTAPLNKIKIDGKTLKATRLPDKDEAFDSWRHSEMKWKRLVSMDESIRFWIAAHFLALKIFAVNQPSPGNVFNASVLCNDLYLRSPTCEGEWLKGKTLGVVLQFIEPADQQEVKDFYIGMITMADKIIQYVKETIES